MTTDDTPERNGGTRTPWFERRFELGRPTGALAELRQALATAPARIAVRLRGVDERVLRTRVGSKWSILENLGHLGDLEPLWAGRVEDLWNSVPELRAADLENRATHEADHNSSELADLVERWTRRRIEWLTRISDFDEEALRRTALHPRLREAMNVVDLCFFVAEHDEHHFGSIEEILAATG